MDHGPPDAPAIVVVHGFPDDPHSFDAVASELLAAGHRVIRPWVPGYPPSEVIDVASVGLRRVAAALCELPSILGLHNPVLVGHDWGAVLGWHIAGTPALARAWTRFVAMSIPPPEVTARAARDPRQILGDWAYMPLLAAPGSEHLLNRVIPALWRRWSPGLAGDPEAARIIDRVLTGVAEPGAARAIVGYYRWIVLRGVLGRFPSPGTRGDLPISYVHGVEDGCVSSRWAEQVQPVIHRPPVLLHSAGHFLHLERPVATAAAILA